MLISIIIPTCNEEKNIDEILDRLSQQTGNYEIIVVDGRDEGATSAHVGDRARIVSTPDETEGAQIKAGAAEAEGDVLLFLDLESRLPAGALQAIGQNLELMPQTIGGNFHLKFEQENLFTRIVARLLKWWRYRGSYCGNSGIFIRTEAYWAIGGIRSDASLTDYDLAWRMEQYGPTVYLPETVSAPAPDFREALKWLLAPIFMRRPGQI